MPELIPVDHDPFNDPPTNLIPVDHDPFASLGAQPKEGQTVAPQNVQTDIASLPPKVAGTVGDMLGLTDAAKALRGEMTPEEAEKFALYAAAGLVTPEMRAAKAAMGAAEKVAPEAAQAVTQGIRAYHGSPYDFDKFDISKIGTGEGNQAYGHGLYFAENPATAAEYRKRLATGKPDDVRPDEVAGQNFGAEWNGILDQLRPIREARDKAYYSGEPYKDLDEQVGGLNDKLDALHQRMVQDTIERNPHLLTGRTYEVNINADPEHFLDWDKPLSEQSEHVKQAIAKVDSSLPVNPPSIMQIKDPTIRNVIRAALQQNEGQASGLELMIDNDGRLYKTVTDHAKRNGVDLEAKDMRASDYVYQQARPFIDALAASQNTTGEMVHRVLGSKGADVMAQGPVAARLHEAGIPGIKYLDQGSRGAGEGTKNYVVFNDKLVDIIKKYGLAGLVAGGAAHYQTTPVDHNPFE